MTIQPCYFAFLKSKLRCVVEMPKTRGGLMRVQVIAAVVALALVGCSPHQEAQEAVKQLLNDPESARFSALTTGKDGNICGMVNAKNRMGGYVGATPFLYEAQAKYAAIVSPPEESDFRSLWLSIKIRSSVADDLSKLKAKCSYMSRWKDVCGTDYPAPKHRLCDVLLQDGAAIYNALKTEYE